VAPAVVGEDRSTQAERGSNVRVMRVRLALELAELWVLADVHLDLRVAPEAEHAGAILTFALLQDAADHGGFAVQRALDASG